MTTKEQTIELAKQAGLWVEGFPTQHIERFAQLVRDNYRAELMAGVGELSDAHDHPEPHTTKWTQLEMDYINRRVAAAVLAARNAALEECADLCDELTAPPEISRTEKTFYEIATIDCAQAIRNLKDKA